MGYSTSHSDYAVIGELAIRICAHRGARFWGVVRSVRQTLSSVGTEMKMWFS